MQYKKKLVLKKKESVDLPISCDAIGFKWIDKLKYNVEDSVKNHKVRLVAK